MTAQSSFPVLAKHDAVTRGDPIDLPVTIKVNGAAVDISAWTFRCQIRRFPNSTVVTASFTVDKVDPVNGGLVLRLSATDSQKLKTGMKADLEQLTPTARTLWQFKLRVLDDVSRGA